MRFEGLLMRASGAAQSIAMNEQRLPFQRDTRMLKPFTSGDEVCSIHEMDIATPKGDMLTPTMADWIRVHEGRIAQQRSDCDAREFAKAFGM